MRMPMQNVIRLVSVWDVVARFMQVEQRFEAMLVAVSNPNAFAVKFDVEWNAIRCGQAQVLHVALQRRARPIGIAPHEPRPTAGELIQHWRFTNIAAMHERFRADRFQNRERVRDARRVAMRI